MVVTTETYIGIAYNQKVNRFIPSRNSPPAAPGKGRKLLPTSTAYQFFINVLRAGLDIFKEVE